MKGEVFSFNPPLISISVVWEMLHHSQLLVYEQARCLFHKKTHSLWNGPESPFLTQFSVVRFTVNSQQSTVNIIRSATGIDITCLGTGKMPVPQENSFFVERAGEPVLDNGATSQLYRNY
ncbi:hypothetical protein D0A37_24360 [Microcoleus vaginatus HSN003]|nr:hypothetical protein D0A37_24360 [Microcoleus vaginatus HSN003]